MRKSLRIAALLAVAVLAVTSRPDRSPAPDTGIAPEFAMQSLSYTGVEQALTVPAGVSGPGRFEEFEFAHQAPGPWPHAPSLNVLTPGAPGKWDDYIVYGPRPCRSLDGTLYREAGTGKALIAYSASSHSNQDADQTGLVTTTDFNTFTRITADRPILAFGSGFYDPSGGTWDGTDAGVDDFICTGGGGGLPKFIIFYEGNRYPNTHGDQVSLGTAASPDGLKWTKYPSNPILMKGRGADADSGDIYGFQAIYDPDEPDSDRRWKAWYSGHVNGGAETVMYATAPTYIGPWTKYNTGGVLSISGVEPGVTQAWKAHGRYYLLIDDLSTLAQTNVWVSKEGVSWKPVGTVLRPGSSGTWDDFHLYNAQRYWDAVDRRWRLFYNARNTWRTQSGIGTASWTGQRPPTLSGHGSLTTG